MFAHTLAQEKTTGKVALFQQFGYVGFKQIFCACQQLLSASLVLPQ